MIKSWLTELIKSTEASFTACQLQSDTLHATWTRVASLVSWAVRVWDSQVIDGYVPTPNIQTSRQYWDNFAGYQYGNALSLRWPFWYTGHWVVSHHST